MLLFRKRIKPGEIKWGGIAIPRAKKGMFPNPRVPFDLHDEKITYQVELDEQFRLRCTEFLRNHPGIKADDEVSIVKEKGTYSIIVSGTQRSVTISLKDLLGKDIKEGRIIDVQHTPTGTVAVVQSTREIPIEKVLTEV